MKNLPAVWETWVQSLGWEDPLEKGMATPSSILAWRILWTEATVSGIKRAGHDWLTLSFSSTPSQRRTTDLHPQGQLGAVEISSQVGIMDLK